MRSASGAGSNADGLRSSTQGASRCAAVLLAFALAAPTHARAAALASPAPERAAQTWIGTWAAAPQPAIPGATSRYENQTLRLIVHGSVGGKQVRIRISNLYGDAPLAIGAAHIARRTTGAEIDPATDRALRFSGSASATIAPGATLTSDPVALDVPALADLAISLFLPRATVATTTHVLAMQTSYASPAKGDFTAAAKLPVGETLDSWPFLSGVEVAGSPRASAVAMFGDSYIDGDGSTSDGNHRWPDALAARLQKSTASGAEIGILNEGIIGNRLLRGSPLQKSNPLGPALGQAGLVRFERDVLSQPGVRAVLVRLGGNDIGLPGNLAAEAEKASAEDVIAGYKQLIEKAHAHGLRIIGTTLTPFENATVPAPTYFSPEKDVVRQQINAWVRSSGAFDAVVDCDQILRDPSHPSRMLPSFDSGDHLHPNDAGYAALANAVPIGLFGAK